MTAELAKKQLELIQREELYKNRARVSVRLEQTGKSYKFRVTNVGDFEARDVNLLFDFVKPEHNPLIDSEYREKFPIKVLAPGDSVSLIAALALGSPTAYNVLLTWKNPDGTEGTQHAYASL